MALWEINIKWVVNDIRNASVYYPIYEWIVNWIHALEKANQKNPKIFIRVIRNKQMWGLSGEKEDALEDIESFEIIDNWVWFNPENQKSFRTFKSDYKLESNWWKWFWRFFYLKFFEKVSFESVYDDNWVHKKIKFDFDIKADDMISNKTEDIVDKSIEIWTKLFLKNLKKTHKTSLNSKSKNVDTLWRKLLEHLLMYFVNDSTKCPEITISDWVDSIKLNSMIWDKEDISVFHNNTITIWEGDKEKFWIKIFKVKYSTENNTISLCWHNRVVIEENLWNFIPDFKQKLKETDWKKDNNYSIKCYVYWGYLDNNVDTERESFDFRKDEDLFKNIISESDIFNETTKEIRKLYKEFLEEQSVIKVNKVKSFVNGKAPWYSALYKNFDFNEIESSISDDNLDSKFHELKYKKEKEAKIKVNNFVKASDFSNKEEVTDLVNSLDDLVKTELAHYVATRKFTLDLLDKSLEWDEESQKYKSEDSVHKIIFPTKKDSKEVKYEDHNMWILDEKLAFTNYISSDKPLNWWTSERPDILVYDNPIALRGDNNISNPVTIFEFKKPWRDDFTLQSTSKEDDPIEQIIRYRNNIVDWKKKTPKWIEIEISDNTPFYWFVICTITQKVKDWLHREKDFQMMPDWKWFFKWHSWTKMYIEVLDWSKVVNDSKTRNRVFFEKLKIN